MSELRFSEGNKPPRPRLRAVLRSDTWAVQLLLLPVIAWAGAGLGVQDGVEGASVFVTLAAAVSAVCLSVLAFRARSFYAFFARGVEVAGEIRAVGSAKGKVALSFDYDYEGTAHTAEAVVFSSEAAKALEVGGGVVVVVDPADPTRARPRDLFV